MASNKEEASKEIKKDFHIKKEDVEEAFLLGCTVREVAAMLDVPEDILDEFCFNTFAMASYECREFFCAKGLAKLKMKIRSGMLEGNIDYHKIYGKALFETSFRPDLARVAEKDFGDKGDPDQIQQYVLQIPKNDRD